VPAFSGIDHLSLSVTGLDEAQLFHTAVLDFTLLVDFGEAQGSWTSRRASRSASSGTSPAAADRSTS
jgi:hypothetical protein